MKIGLFLSLSLATLTLVNCGSKHEDPPPSIKVVNGDPYVFVKNTSMNNGSLEIPAHFFYGSDKFLATRRGFIENELQPIDNEKQATKDLKKNQTPLETQAEYLKSINELISEGRISVYRSSDEIHLRGVKDGLDVLSFKRTPSGKYKLDLSSLDIQLLHTSLKDDGSALSLLLYGVLDGRRFLISYELRRTEEFKSSLSFIDKSFNYLLGPGVKTAWNQNQKVQLSTCEFKTNTDWSDSVPEGLKPWERDLKGKLALSGREYKNCPPFSDLNFHGFYFVSDWIEILGASGVAGLTSPTYDLIHGEIIDSDIFILLSELEESVKAGNAEVDIFSKGVFDKYPRLKKAIVSTYVHEIGHFLGLHHQFDPSKPSVMSYDAENRIGLTSYDRKAIQTLYP